MEKSIKIFLDEDQIKTVNEHILKSGFTGSLNFYLYDILVRASKNGQGTLDLLKSSEYLLIEKENKKYEIKTSYEKIEKSKIVFDDKFVVKEKNPIKIKLGPIMFEILEKTYKLQNIINKEINEHIYHSFNEYIQFVIENDIENLSKIDLDAKLKKEIQDLNIK